MAEAILNKLAAGRAKAISAGTAPAEAVNPLVVAVMHEVGIDISHNKPKALTPAIMEQANRVITMGCAVEEVCPTTSIETEDWKLEDPAGKTGDRVREIREQVHARVMKLLEEIPEKNE